MANKGDVSVGFVLAALMKAGKFVLWPVSYNSRYDLLIEEDNKFIKVQCKTGRLARNGDVIAFNTCSTNHRGERKNYIGEVDFFGVHCNGRVFLVPTGNQKASAWLRIKEPNKLSGKSPIRMAKDFEIIA